MLVVLPRVVCAVALLAAGAGRARADITFVAEVPAAIAVSEAQRGVYRVGSMPAGGVYTGGPRLALGLRMRAGVLRDGPAPTTEGVADPGAAGLIAASVAVRAGLRGAWLELAGGRGLTGSDSVPVVEVGIGYGLRIASLEVGPSARLVRVIADADPMHTLGSADLLLVGVDVRWGVRAPAPRRAPVARVAQVPPRAPRPAPPAERADPVEPLPDRLVDLDASCVAAPDACPLPPQVEVEADRLVLDDAILFDLDRARVRTQGRTVIRQIAELWRRQPTWTRIRIEGHTDTRGREAWNVELSRLRAERVRDQLVRQGGDPARIEAVGLGSQRPRTVGTSEAAHRRNRRVEFVILTTDPDDAGAPAGAPAGPPTGALTGEDPYGDAGAGAEATP